MCIGLSTGSLAQAFQDFTSESQIDASTTGLWGAGCSIVDYDLDGDNDVVVLADSLAAKIYRNNGFGSFELATIFPDSQGNEMLTFVDYDNDGDLDMFLTQNNHPNYLYQRQEDGSFIDVTADAGLPIINDPSYGHCWGDINNDGWLDLYVCNYITNDVLTSENFLFTGSEEGVFTDISVSSGTSDGLKSSFQAVFIDYDRDGLQDIFVANDRTPYQNTLYHNEGNNTFSDVTFASNMGDYIWSMSNTVGDINNDGLFEIYMCNNADGNLLKSFDGVDSFEDIAAPQGVEVNEFCWGAQFFDYNNDGWQDLYVNSSVFFFWNSYGNNHLYTNAGGTAFDLQAGEEFESAEYSSFSSAVGDIDGDGDLDLLCSNRSDVGAKMWKNVWFNTGNYLDVNLHGTVSNTMGIGSWIEAWYGGNQYQMQYVNCGEAYLTQNPYTEHFGLGTHEVIDSLQVSWLSGIVDTYYDVDVNQEIDLWEGGISVSIYAENEGQICPGGSLLLSTDAFDEYSWSTGSDSSSTLVYEPGLYTVSVITEQGLLVESESFEVEMAEAGNWQVIAIEPDCYPDTTATLLIFGPDAVEASFSDTLSFNPAEVTSGAYTWAVVDGNTCTYTGQYNFDAPIAMQAEASSVHPLCHGDSTGAFDVLGSGGTGLLEISYPDSNALLPAGTYPWLITDAAGCELSGEVTIDQPDELVVDIDLSNVNEDGSGFIDVSVEGGTPPYVFSYNGVIDPENWNTTVGEQIVLVTDSNGCEVEEVLLITSVDDLEGAFRLQPNPADRFFDLMVNAPCHFMLYDVSGRLLMEETLHSGQHRLNSAGLPNGNYVGHLVSPSERFTFQLFIAH